MMHRFPSRKKNSNTDLDAAGNSTPTQLEAFISSLQAVQIRSDTELPSHLDADPAHGLYNDSISNPDPSGVEW
jgi:hypothetical protein